MAKVNVVIPMAGQGIRFVEAGIYTIKPLIPISGIPMVIRAIQTLGIDANYIFIIRRNKDFHKLKFTLLNYDNTAKIIEVDDVTDGAATTAMLAKKLIDNQNELIIANCDQIMKWNSQDFLNHARQFDGCVVTFTDDNPRNSYAKISSDGMVEEVREKEVISNTALNGIHYWKHGSDFVQSYNSMVEDGANTNGEYYVSTTYNYMLKNNSNVGIYHIPNQQYINVGTPEKLKEYLDNEDI
jgi:dTDP-glucose pyrophosphorylase